MKRFEILTQKDLAPMFFEIKKILGKGRVIMCDVKSKSNKTPEQLGYYYGAILPAVQRKFIEDGNEYSQGEIHKFFKNEFFFIEKLVCGKLVKEIKSLSGATIEEMTAYIDRVMRWCYDEGIPIPEPQTYNAGTVEGRQ
jgi:hypothetical protein